MLPSVVEALAVGQLPVQPVQGEVRVPFRDARARNFALARLDDKEARRDLAFSDDVVAEAERPRFQVACNGHQILCLDISEQTDALQEPNLPIEIVLLVIIVYNLLLGLGLE